MIVGRLIPRNTIRIYSERPRVIQRSIKMVLLGYHYTPFHSKNMTKPIHAVISRKTRVITKNGISRHALLFSVKRHCHYFIVRSITIITTHNDFRGYPFVVECDGCIEAIFQNSRRATIPINPRAKHNNGICPEGILLDIRT